jgi:hypothetical protein
MVWIRIRIWNRNRNFSKVGTGINSLVPQHYFFTSLVFYFNGFGNIILSAPVYVCLSLDEKIPGTGNPSSNPCLTLKVH